MLDRLKQHIINAPGWRTKRKIVVFESDDWGAVRITNKQGQKALHEAGVRVGECHYMMYDSLESVSDLDRLYEVLIKHKNQTGENPVFTANCLSANPDFDRIKNTDFLQYYWEDIEQTQKRYPEKGPIINKWKEGIRKGVFHLQSHGREHCNISRWMSSLQTGDPITLLAFKFGIYGVSGHVVPQRRGSFLSAFDAMKENFIVDQSAVVKEGLILFEKITGYRSKTFIAPNYVWSEQIEKAAADIGVMGFQGTTTQRLPVGFPGNRKLKRHYLGQRNTLGQRYLVRNAMFEPSENRNKDWVDSCLKEIKIAFYMRKPAIISTHRVNYVGDLDSRNSDHGLRELGRLLHAITTRWPDVEFMHSEALLDLINIRN